MEEERYLAFGSFRLDLRTNCVYRGKQMLRLTPKAFAVLRYLLQHSNQVVTKDELLDAVWQKDDIEEAALVVCVREIRMKLGDTRKKRRFIEAVRGQGYWWIAPVVRSQELVASRQLPPPLPPQSQHLIPTLVGREAELERLHRWLDQALAGQRQIVFITGEPGIGKTALVDVFVTRVGASGKFWLGHGQCIEQSGAGQAYGPVLEALRRMSRVPGGKRLLGLLSQHAPTWLGQLPSLPSPARSKAVKHKLQGTTPERMLLEMAEAVEILTSEHPVVLVLEDLQWSDPSTVALLDCLACRREPARLLVIGTYRPEDTIAAEHPLKKVKQELLIHQKCEELEIDYLTALMIEQYLTVRFSRDAQLPLEALAKTIHRRTEGNPLFMVNIVDELVTQDIIACADGTWTLQKTLEGVEEGVPANLQELIEARIDRLPSNEQRLLEVGSVAGMEFSARAVAAGVGKGVEEVEERCEKLARQAQFLRKVQTAGRTEGTATRCYQFLHALYRSVLYERVPTEWRRRLHRLIGEHEAAAYGVGAKEIAAELAVHFEQAGEYQQAVHYLTHAAQNALERNAPQETIVLVNKGLELLKILPDTLTAPDKKSPCKGFTFRR